MLPAALGLPLPGQTAGQPRQTAQVFNLGGMLRVGNQASALPAPMETNAQQQAQPVIQGLAGEIRNFWTRAVAARTVVEQEMLAALRARRGEYAPEKLAQIAEQRQPAIYMMLAAAKMRQIESLLRDVLIGLGTDKPWSLRPTPNPELPPSLVQQAIQQLAMEIEQASASGMPPSLEMARQRLRDMRNELAPRLMEMARERSDRMERKLEDQMLEGGYLDAIDQFITDLATFKTAFLAGPIIRRKPQLKWGQDGELIVEQKLVCEWERVDPFDMYPAPWAANLLHAPFIRKHRLTRQSLNEMIGVEGFSEASIREVLKMYDDRGYRESQSIDSQKAIAEGKTQGTSFDTGLIDALQYWGSASGKMLLDWGMDKAQVPDPAMEYQIEAWLIGGTVIKAVLNADPLARRPIYHCSFQMVPGSVWGNAPYDLMVDCQDMCNGAARSLAANLGISSGPQVAVLSNRMPAGEDLTEMYPWKIWQFESDPMGSTAAPISFFQPSSNANELMTVYERFSLLADEYTGIPRYMAGFNGGEGGAGRTASGISMMIGNASKVIKQVVGTIDTHIITKMLERQYYHNMRYETDPDLKGDVKIVARGAMSLASKDAAQVRNNEMLTLALNSPVAQEIMGVEGVAELLRGSVKTLDHNADRVVPSNIVLRQRMAEQQAQQAAMMAQQAAMGMEPGSEGEPGRGVNQPKKQGGRQLQNGAPATDNYGPQEK